MVRSATVTAAAQLSEQLLSKTTPQQPPTFAFTPFLQKTYLHSLPADRPICRAYTNGHCPLGTRCSERHVSSTTKQEGGSGGGHPFNSLVCKHWLRGLCKKGETCEFLHEFNLRKMPECNFFLRNGFCSNGDECLYLHIDPQSKLPPCPHYDRGFCPLGPRCAKKHVRKKMCPYFLAGFCPDGRDCKEGAHPKWRKDKDLEKPQVKVEKKEEDISAVGMGRHHFDDDEEGSMSFKDRGDRNRDRDRERDRGHDRAERGDRGQGRFGGRGGRWRGRGSHRARGGRH
ncbi:RNA-binding component of cleavage and polyadenylation factor [Gnomoniopsis smithogilvyi]|uniref:mRNA 3'-end-processing protein n=1 Tax=Gnomoniopsis smithogilvyi TaxID=1191159 RepID=A0A9W8YYL9_9PEZI|nr:RNA-binding component of cleavage and polyadenylation factor [Gnomoniopsis smithogilvyi]